MVVNAEISYFDQNNPDESNQDENNQDGSKKYSYEWSDREHLLTDIDSVEDRFSFEPKELTPGIYHIRVDVIDLDDPLFTTHQQITLKLVENKVILTDADTDKDGIPDNIEVLSDSDSDGIPDYLDNRSDCNVLPEQVATSDNFLLEADPGVCLRLGDSALNGESGGVLAFVENSDDDIDNEVINIGGIFDFIASNLSIEGQILHIVVPQIKPIPANAIYRKQTTLGQWVDFVESSNDQLWSAAGEAGYCPSPGAETWQVGLIEGYWCVQLQISDGGPNDADGVANKTIVDPGGVAVLISNNNQPIAVDDEAEVKMNTSLMLDVLSNDSDPDGDTLEISSANANFGTVTIENNQLNYQTLHGYIGTDTVIYGVTDRQGGSSSATLLVTVILNENPVANNDTATAFAGHIVIIDVI